MFLLTKKALLMNVSSLYDNYQYRFLLSTTNNVNIDLDIYFQKQELDK